MLERLKKKFKTENEFQTYQQYIIKQGNRAINEEDLSHWSDLDWYVWENNINELY